MTLLLTPFVVPSTPLLESPESFDPVADGTYDVGDPDVAANFCTFEPNATVEVTEAQVVVGKLASAPEETLITEVIVVEWDDVFCRLTGQLTSPEERHSTMVYTSDVDTVAADRESPLSSRTARGVTCEEPVDVVFASTQDQARHILLEHSQIKFDIIIKFNMNPATEFNLSVQIKVQVVEFEAAVGIWEGSDVIKIKIEVEGWKGRNFNVMIPVFDLGQSLLAGVFGPFCDFVLGRIEDGLNIG
ncbi:hypothetical protein N7492_006851 [Penicillium capsulatum]|uniref:Uncharacterized protein n=1 Tax=Penicillium capsulatum TaxID=69766 RepID=A0A9W9HYP9_9EURO|nr:hypothetical protein N7492_006851 [Penicillium capsulatum]KAJ6116685.1 hypothetical protein N7512_006410 [Penicillium capsulatum]